MPAPSFFTNRVAVIATMHRKEQVIAPLVESALGVKTLIPTNFNTDNFGTFTRETKRPADQLTTARLKAKAALKLSGKTLAIASEGSFGPHPQLPFAACNRELVLLYDLEHELEIVGEQLSTETNYQSQTVSSPEEALAFASSVGFPEHGLVVMRVASTEHETDQEAGRPTETVAKGITVAADLIQAVTLALEQSVDRKAHVETDMRALYNPTRMDAIAQATIDLIKKATHLCPRCHYPGFVITQRFPGLPCSLCGAATLLTRSVRYSCQHCQFQQDQPSPDLPPGSPPFADPAHCFYCNP
ncbi:hypothetical protein S7335_4973 [Synechococcus sp. PCC 7335]|uniref:DUF6671 family protein n=1 Tax=Synechococcus sp. (strain ATCC 29403 / PCC 7335) TaxID=91464 RepID=UPI00017EB10B|nr:DUF6671 family protein [Synechococcus sp. PCC 7335]EDX87265.1 hypothetical protein S7335_4973 [Synechococcus sp. PCC 7335]